MIWWRQAEPGYGVIERDGEDRLLVASLRGGSPSEPPCRRLEPMPALTGIDASILEADHSAGVGQGKRYRHDGVLTAVQLDVFTQAGEARVPRFEGHHVRPAMLRRDQREGADVGADVVEHIARTDGVAEPVDGPWFLGARRRAPLSLHLG